MKYAFVRVIGALLQVVGWILIVASIFLAVKGPGPLDSIPAATASEFTKTIASFTFLWTLLGAGSLFLYGLLLIFLGQMSKVFVDIARNTAPVVS